MNELGRIGRPRGLDGWLRFEPSDARAADYISENLIVYIKNNRSGFRPLRIEEIYTEEKRNQTTFFVKFDMITSRTEAESVKDKSLFSDQFDLEIESEYAEDDKEPDYTGYLILHNEETAGTVLDLMQNPAHSILEVKIGIGTLLIPFVDEYVRSVDHKNRQIVCQNLEQLTDEEL